MQPLAPRLSTKEKGHEEVLVDCATDVELFVEKMRLLAEAGPPMTVGSCSF